MKIKIFLAVSFLSTMAFSIQDLELNVVDQNFSSSNKIVISADQIKKSHATSVAQLLSSQANITVASTSFQPNSIYLRGGDSSHVLILIDGVPTYDPSTVQRTVNLGNLNLKNIKKIEIIKGSQSVVYGGQALSGVISIETFPAQIAAHSELNLESGSNQNQISAGQIYPISPKFAVSNSILLQKIEGLSPVLHSAKLYPDQLGAADASILIKPTELDKMILHFNYSDSQTQIATTDFATFKALDTENFSSNTESFNSTFLYKKENMFQFSLAYQSTRRLFLQNAIDGGGAATDQDYRGQLLLGRFDFHILDTQKNHIFAGYNHTQETMKYLDTSVVKSESDYQNEGLFIKADSELGENILLEAGARHQMSQLKSLDDTYQVGLTLNKEIKIEYATGFKSPSLFQLFSSYGNTNLQPEKAKSASISYEKKINDDLFFSITGFDSRFDNLIVIKGSPQRYENVSSTRTVGGEVLASKRDLNSSIDYILSLGYQEPTDLSTNTWLVRRPLRTASLKISKTFYDKLTVATEINHTGSRRDREAGGRYLTIDDYTLMNLIMDLKLNDKASVFARFDNVTDQVYQPAFGFYTQGTSAKAGLQLSF
jgi:iron complex outermembrane recepter protein